MRLREHQIRHGVVHSLTPCLPESIQLCAPVLVFMGAAGEGHAQNRIAIFFIQ